jgi:hypothetical protein
MKRFAMMLTLPVVISAAALLSAQTTPTRVPQPAASALEQMHLEAGAMRKLINSDLGQAFLDSTSSLRAIRTRNVYRDKETKEWFSPAQYKTLPDARKRVLEPVPCDERMYYMTKYGSPISYVRPIEMLGQSGVTDFNGKRVLDFGYGTIGQLTMMAACGADVVGLDVDPFLSALYSHPHDQGPIGTTTGTDGSVSLVSGRFTEADVRDAVGSGFDVIISKNTLKRGFIHPAANVDKDKMVDLGMNDEAFMRIMYAIMKPGGRFIIYNLSPKQGDASKGEKYIPWADGRCPFDREMLLRVGFRVVMFDQQDTRSARMMAKAMGWNRGEKPMDIDNDLFAHVTLLEKPARD